MRKSTSWTDQECERLRELIQGGCSAARASVIFKRTLSSVQSRARKLGMPFPNRRELKKDQLRKLEAAERDLRRSP